MGYDLVVLSRRVFVGTGDDACPLGLAIEGGKIVATFSPDEFEAYAARAAEVVDYGDALVTPGLHDAHQHVFQAALFSSDLALECLGESEQDVVSRMEELAKRRTSGWLIGHGWRETAWGTLKMPSRASLDAAFPNRPVALLSGDAHTVWTNSAGLVALGIDEKTQPPAGGSFDRDEEGRLTGILRESAGMLYFSRVLATLEQEELVGIYKAYFSHLSELGVTSVCDMALSLVPGADGIHPEVYEELLARGELDVRAHLFPTLSDDQSNLEELQGRLASNMLRAPGFKQFFDGVSSQHTAWVREPYENARFDGDVGRPTVGPARMRELVLAAAKRGHAVRIHTIGDRAVGEAISIFEEARRLYGEPSQGANTLEHLEDITPEDIRRLRDARIVASVQPPHAVLELDQPARDLGEWRARRMWPFATMADSGVTLAFGTDAPVVPPAGTDVLFCAVARQTPDTHEPVGGWYPHECVGMAQALRAYTAGSAAAAGRSHELGTLETGMLADFVVWDKDLLAMPAREVQAACPRATYVGGRKVFSA